MREAETMTTSNMGRASTNRPGTANQITHGDIRLLLSAALFLGAVLVKTSGAAWAAEARVQAAALLHGGVSADEVLQVAGQMLDGGGLSAVTQVFAGLENQETSDTGQSEPGADQSGGQDAALETTSLYAESGYGEDDLANRVQSNFPKESDTMAYVLNFDTQAPVEGVKTSAFGTRVHPISGKESFHYGLDIGAAEGTPIYAFAAGTVREAGTSKSYGNYAVIDHADGFSTLYAHCSKVDAQAGDTVAAGDKIAEVGATGNATGNHLHLEIWRDGKALDPAQYVNV